MRMPSGFSTSARVLVTGLLPGLVSTALAQELAAVGLTASARGDGVQVSITSVLPLAAAPRVDGREVLVVFDGPVRVDVPPGLLETTAGWIAGVQTGYDTLLLRAAREVDVVVSGRDDGVDVGFAARGPADPVADALGQRRLGLLRAQLEAARGQEASALSTLSALAAGAPDDAQVLTALGLAQRRVGWWRPAQATLTRAVAADRANPEVRLLLANLRAERAPRALFEYERKDVARQWHTRSQRSEGLRAAGEALQVGGRLELLQFDARKVRRPSGEISPLRRNLARGEAWLAFETRAGATWSASLFGAPSGPGASVAFSQPQPSGRWTLQAEVHRPFWEYAEALADNGTRDRVAVERRQRIGRRVDSWVTLAATRYAIDTAAATRTTGVSGGVLLAVREAGPSVLVSYGLDKETRRAATLRTDATGATYAPVPIVSREIHVPALQVRQGLGS